MSSFDREPPPLALSQFLHQTFYAVSPLDDGRTGTCFSVNYKGSAYLVTAAHVYAFCGDNSGVWLLKADPKGHLRPTRFLCEFVAMDRKADVAVARIGDERHSRVEFVNDFAVGGRCQFLGYPFGWRVWNPNLEEVHPFGQPPFVKGGIVSGELGDGRIVLDALVNPGFSGGPVLAHDSDGRLGVIGVVLSMSTTPSEVKVGGPGGKTVKDPSGKSLVALSNAGLVVCARAGVVGKIIDESAEAPGRLYATT